MEPNLLPLSADAQLALLQQKNVELQELEQLKNTFISTASHQLRTPLTALKWILSSLESDPELKKMQSKQLLVKQASISVERIIDLVNDLLNASRIHNGHLPYRPQQTDIAQLISACAATLQETMASKNIHFNLTIEPNIPIVDLDPLLIKEALHNLLNNAIDYTLAGGTISLVVNQSNEEVLVEVTDTGIGISADEQEKIFLPFFRGAEAIQTHPDGSGLGLYLTQAIIKEHHGSIEVSSQLGVQTTVKMSLPISQ